MLQDFHEEYAMEAFRRYDQLGSGFISALDFQDIMINIKSHLLTEEVKANLVAAAAGGQGGKRVSFPYFMAFNYLLNNMELIKRIYLNATNGNRNQEVTKGVLISTIIWEFLFCRFRFHLRAKCKYLCNEILQFFQCLASGLLAFSK
jgi:hypothetical protein